MSKLLKEYHLIRHAKAEKVEVGLHDRDRQLSEIGQQQLKQLVITLKAEGTVFNQVFFSPVIRTETVAKAIWFSFTAVPCELLYDPDPNSTNARDAIDGTILGKAFEIFGYDLKGWYSDPRVADIVRERMFRAAEEIREKSKSALKVAIVGHFLYLNALAQELAGHQSPFFRQIPIGECERFVVRITDDGTREIFVPFGEKLAVQD